MSCSECKIIIQKGDCGDPTVTKCRVCYLKTLQITKCQSLELCDDTICSRCYYRSFAGRPECKFWDYTKNDRYPIEVIDGVYWCTCKHRSRKIHVNDFGCGACGLCKDDPSMAMYVSASHVSTVAGRHQYRDANDELFKIVRANYPKIYERMMTVFAENSESSLADDMFYYKLEQQNIQNINDMMLYFMDSSDNLSISVDKKTYPTTQDIVSQEYEDYKTENLDLILELLNQDSLEDLSDLDPNIKRGIIMDRGTFKEKEAITLLRSKFPELKAGNDKMLYARHKNIKIGGKVDVWLYKNGICVGIIEIKTRAAKAFGRSKMTYLQYDIDQLASYQFLTQELKLTEFYICEFALGKISLTKFENIELSDNWDILAEALENVQEKIKSIDAEPAQQWIYSMIENALAPIED